MIKERVIQLAVGFAVGPLKRDAQFAVKIFDHILEIRCPRQPESLAYSDAVRDLQAFSVHHLQRLAMRFADHLVVRSPSICCSRPNTDDVRRYTM